MITHHPSTTRLALLLMLDLKRGIINWVEMQPRKPPFYSFIQENIKILTRNFIFYPIRVLSDFKFHFKTFNTNIRVVFRNKCFVLK